MARPKLDPARIAHIRRLRGQGKTIDEIEALMEEAELWTSRGAIARYTKEYDHQQDAEKTLDAPFEWYRLDEYGLPWEASAYLLDVLAKARIQFLAQLGTPSILFRPATVREVRWWWRIHLAAPAIEWFDVVQIARAFASRELASQILGKPLFVADLEALVVYHPWSGADSKRSYHEAVEHGVAPEVISNPLLDVFISDKPENVQMTAIIQFGWWPSPTSPHLLPSEVNVTQSQRSSTEAKEQT